MQVKPEIGSTGSIDERETRVLDPVLRPVKDAIAAPFAERLTWLSPNLITTLSTGSGLAAAALLALPHYGGALVVWIASRLLDGLDGAVARSTGRQTDFGGYYDIVGDFAVYAALPIGLVLGRGPLTAELVAVCILLASFFVNAASWMYLSAILEKRGRGASARGEVTTVAMPDAIIGGAESLLFFTAMILLPHHTLALAYAMAVLVFLSVGQRLLWAWRSID